MTALHLVVESLSINTMNYESIIDSKGFINSESTKVETLHHLAMPRYSVHKNYEQTKGSAATKNWVRLTIDVRNQPLTTVGLYLIPHNNST